MSRYLAPILLASLLPYAAGNSCNADNCLRAFRATSIPGRLDSAQSFCLNFAAQTTTATASIPTYAVAACKGDVASRVSSACSCIAASTTQVSTSAATATSLAPTSTAGPKSCINAQLSCHNTTAVADTCCLNAPGGELLVTQFWDTNPSTGPSDAWTIHGLWPDNCDGTYNSFCDTAREYTNITAILTSYGKGELLAFMKKYWKDYQGNDESFWEHEWNKHGTCISTLEPGCYNDYTAQEEVVDFFQTAVNMYKTLDSYHVLAKAGIIPSLNATYTYDQIQAAIKAAHGYNITIQCNANALDELWYYYNVLGSVQTGEFVAAPPDGTKSSCPPTGIKYIPKSYNATVTTTSSANPSATKRACKVALKY